ncbi:MAG: serine hydroxymethyltransferase [Candidatus Freyarchaeota archaeon]
MIEDLVKRHEEWRSQCINLIPSENIMSPRARAVLSSDLGHRYTSPDKFYTGTKYIDQIIEEGEKLAKKVFRCKFADLRPISGHVADLSLLMAFRGKSMACIGEADGGYPGISQDNAPSVLGIKVHYLPYKQEEANIDLEGSIKLIEEKKPNLVILGASFIPMPYPVSEISAAAHKVGALLAYDASHVMGLIAGKKFQQPLAEGADIMMGSTHKTLPGPQGGIILGNSFEEIKEHLLFKTIDNAHFHRIAALAVTLEEMQKFGEAYASQIVKNSKKLASLLDEASIPLKCKSKGFTESHQILVNAWDFQVKFEKSWVDIVNKLEEANVIMDRAGRIGTNEVTRIGMKEEEMEKICDLILRAVKGEKKEDIKEEAVKLKSQFTKVHYCFSD